MRAGALDTRAASAWLDTAWGRCHGFSDTLNSLSIRADEVIE